MMTHPVTMVETCVQVSFPVFSFCEYAETKPPQAPEVEADYRF
jgi:hypothetical protein